MRRLLLVPLLIFAVLALSAAASIAFSPPPQTWSAAERRLIDSLLLDNLPAPPPDPSNRVADDPRAAALGEQLFFDPRLSANGKIACASCHQPDLQFQDGLPRGRGIGDAVRRTPALAGAAHSPFLFWDGRRDSLWSQALTPLENAVEHGSNRTALVHVVGANYRAQYEAVFGTLPDLAALPSNAAPAAAFLDPYERVVNVADTLALPPPEIPAEVREATAAWAAMAPGEQQQVNRAFANIGKAIAAFERAIEPTPARFDAYARALASGSDTAGLLSPTEIGGLRLFIGEARCVSCHSGPLFTDNQFHNTGVPVLRSLPEDTGRVVGARMVRSDPFNCLGEFSDAAPEQCTALESLLIDRPGLVRAYKPPSLRGVVTRAPYMHSGQIATLEAVLRHYTDAPPSLSGTSELHRLALTPAQTSALIAFLATLGPEPAAE
jgi:cytochrome c peroxidase